MAKLKESGSRIPKTWLIIFNFSLIKSFRLTKSENRTKKRELFAKKKKLTSAKLRRSWHHEIYYLKHHMRENFRNKFQFFSIILTNFNQMKGWIEGNYTPPPP